MGQLEADFGLHELFFSKTDFKGLIQCGNEVFVRVSEFSREDLNKRPHNIIRHPDMPRSVFKIFWDFLKAEKPVAAYVKNRSRNGRYYWVFAMAFPMKDGYLSIRLKPTSEVFNKVKRLYQKILFDEDSLPTLEEAQAILEQRICLLGFKNYEDFMITALLAEMKSRDEIYKNNLASQTYQLKRSHLERLLLASRECTLASRSAFQIAEIISEKVQNLKNRSSNLDSLCQQVRLITTNLAIASSRLGEPGRPLTVVSNNLERLTFDIASSTKDFENIFLVFQETARYMHFYMGTSRFQIEMMHHLLEETLYLMTTSGNLQESQLQEVYQNCQLLQTLISDNFQNVENLSRNLTKESKSIVKSISMLGKVTAGMDVVCVVGKIEMARIAVLSSSLEALLADMENLTRGFKDELRQMENDSQWGLNKSNELKIYLSHITNNLKKVEMNPAP